MRPKPSVSVIIPSYNCARFLPEAIESVRAQAFPSLEIVVVDDGSTDNTRDVVASWQDVKYIRQDNQGPSAARNRGLAETTGDFVALLDADDLWTPDHLDTLLPPLLDDATLQFSWGNVQVIQLGPASQQAEVVEVVEENSPLFLVGATVCRRSVFQQVGEFDTDMRLAEDLDWIARARQCEVPYAKLDSVVLIYRKHDQSLTAGKSFHELNLMAMLKRSIQRHRSNNSHQESTAARSA